MDPNNETSVALFEALLNQGEAIRELKLELEALKNMFFEHRPPFIEAFAQHRAKLLESGALRRVDDQLAALRGAVEMLRTGH